MAKKKKRKLRLGRVLLVFLLSIIIGFTIYSLTNVKITNIFIHDNYYLTDQEIIEQAGISDYPGTLKYTRSKIKNNLLKLDLIKNVKVVKKGLSKVHIYVEENSPLFYNEVKHMTVLKDGSETNVVYNVPTLLNYVPDTIYPKFVKKMTLIDIDIINKVSEIKYDPDEVDEYRFSLYMTDSNYVYLTLNKFELVNNYIEIMKDEKFIGKKGVLYLDSGNHFEVLED